MYVIYNQVNVLALFDNCHIVLNRTAHVMYSPLNSYVYIHWILDFKYILILLLFYEYLYLLIYVTGQFH